MIHHPLIDLVVKYYDDFFRLKSQQIDLSNMAFNSSYGLYLDVPVDWPYVNAIKAVCDKAKDQPHKNNILIIYDSTEVYDFVSGIIGRKGISYMSWHEILTAFTVQQKDVQNLTRAKERVSSAEMVFFVGASKAVPDVINWVKAFCSGCLIFFG